MTDFSHQHLSGSRIDEVDLSGSRIDEVDLSGSRIDEVDLSGCRFGGRPELLTHRPVGPHS